MSTLGTILDNLGIDYEPDDGELVVEAVVVLRTINGDDEGIKLRSHLGSSWAGRVGLLELAKHIEMDGIHDS